MATPAYLIPGYAPDEAYLAGRKAIEAAAREMLGRKVGAFTVEKVLIERRLGQRVNIGKTLHEALEIRDYGGHLGLLQHDLADPHSVGIGVPAPGHAHG